MCDTHLFGFCNTVGRGDGIVIGLGSLDEPAHSKGSVCREAGHGNEHEDIVSPEAVPPEPETGVGTKGDGDEGECPRAKINAQHLIAMPRVVRSIGRVHRE